MKYVVTCECGKTQEVTAGDAGASLACGCGRTLTVPNLVELRASPPSRIRRSEEEGDNWSDEDDAEAGSRKEPTEDFRFVLSILGVILVAASLVWQCIAGELARLPGPTTVGELLIRSFGTVILSAVGTAVFASARGYSSILGFLLGFFTGPLGLLALALFRVRRR